MFERAIGVPKLVAGLVDHAAIGPIHELAFLLGIQVREIDQVLMQPPFLADRVDRRLERTEAPAEGHLLLVAEALIGKHEHGKLLEGVEDLLEGWLVERPSQIHPLDPGGEVGVERRDDDSLECGHGGSSFARLE